MKIAIVCDWLSTIGGAEKVMEQMLECFPNADLFSLVDFLAEKDRHIIKNKKVKTAVLQKLPFARRRFRNYLLFMPFAIEQLDLSSYDVIISSSHAVAKGVLTGPRQLHICYCHSPMRYAWDLQNQYLKEANLDKGLKGLITKYVLHKMRLWDVTSSARVDYFIANSKFIANRINKYYRRNVDAVIYPPVLTSAKFHQQRLDFYVTASRLVPYKKIDLIVETFVANPSRKLFVIGDGPMQDLIKKKAHGHPNIEVLGYQNDQILHDYLSKAKAFVFAAEEDFGIIPVEAQSFGCPVIAFAKGGALETVIGINQDSMNPTGVFFNEQTVDCIEGALLTFETNYKLFNAETCHNNAMRFSNTIFRQQFTDFVNEKMVEYEN